MAASGEQYQRATVTYRKDHAEDLWSIRVQLEQRLLFQPGQYATLGIEVDGRLVERDYQYVLARSKRKSNSFSNSCLKAV
jgi:ferredoxin-NADP reductase